MTDTAATDTNGYIALPVEQDWQTLATRAYEYLAENIAGWEPAPANLDVLIIEAIAQQAAELTETAATVPTAIFRYFGQGLVGITPQDATAATGEATITVTDDAGYTIAAGYTVGLRAADGTLIAFQAATETEIAEGDTTAAAVAFTALEPGAAGTSLSGPAELIDELAIIASVVFTANTTGGNDGESDDDYLNRLSAALQLLSTAPILPDDFARLAEQNPNVERATAINLYNADTEADDEPRCVTVAICDSGGEPVSAGTKTDVQAALEAKREVNFEVFVIDPTYTEIAVDVTVQAYSGWDTDDVTSRLTDAVASYLSPGQWGQRRDGRTQTATWDNTITVRYLEVAEVINRVDGVDFITELLVDGAAIDVAITGTAPLTRAGDLTVTTTAP
jgi:uncharacterized phage protein gp47/JayE